MNRISATARDIREAARSHCVSMKKSRAFFLCVSGNRIISACFLLAAVIVIEAVVLLYRGSFFLPFFVHGPVSYEALADRVISACKGASYRPGCYDKEIPKLMKEISMEDVFKITRIVQEKDQGYWYCHVLGHELSGIETAKDPSRWKDVVARCPADMCSNGCLHGAFQERFRVEALPAAHVDDLVKELDGICEERSAWHPTGLQKGTCYHALGHLMMYITGADIGKSTALCEKSAKGKDGQDFSPLCFDGAYMQIYQPLEPEDFALVKGKQPTKENLKAFCATVSGERQASCWSEGWPLYANEIKTPKGLVAFCRVFADDARRKSCYNDIFYVLTAQFNFREDTIENFCVSLPADVRGQCFASAASRLIETDWRLVTRSVALCASAARSGVGDTCYNEMLASSRYNFQPDSEAFLNLCGSLPAPWKERCLQKN